MSPIIDTIDLNNYNIRPLVVDSADGRTPRIMTVAGSDSSGGAGIEADLKTFTAHKCYGLTCINSLTAQNTTGVQDAFELPYDFVVKILDSNFQDIDIDVIKTGMLSEQGIKALLHSMDKHHFQGQLVIDPVMVSTSGFELSKKENLKLIIDQLISRADLITPNMLEAKAILSIVDDSFTDPLELYEYYDKLEITDKLQMQDFCRKIVDKTGVKNVLIKGGHVHYKDDLLVDVLYEANIGEGKFTLFESKFQDSTDTHGTGCTLLSAIAANLGKKLNLVDAVGNGIVYVQNGIKRLDGSIGSGHGPLDHFEVHQPLKFHQVEYNGESLMPFLINHPFVKQDWQRYIHHPFVEKVARLELPIENFFDYLKQDYVYLTSYAKTHCLALVSAPNVKDLDTEVNIMRNTLQEMGKHKLKLQKLGISEEELNKVEVCELGKAYSDYLFKVAKHGSWLEINISLAACLFGYREAATYAQTLYREKDEEFLKNTLYKEWLDDYTSEWYHKACVEGEAVIKDCTFESLELAQLLEIFGNVVKLEVQFWDSFLD